MKLDNKIAVITGAASGIGHTVAQYLAVRGARVVGVDLDGTKVEVARSEAAGAVVASSPRHLTMM